MAEAPRAESHRRLSRRELLIRSAGLGAVGIGVLIAGRPATAFRRAQTAMNSPSDSDASNAAASSHEPAERRREPDSATQRSAPGSYRETASPGAAQSQVSVDSLASSNEQAPAGADLRRVPDDPVSQRPSSASSAALAPNEGAPGAVTGPPADASRSGATGTPAAGHIGSLPETLATGPDAAAPTELVQIEAANLVELATLPSDAQRPFLFVAAANASQVDRELADFRCSRDTNDDKTIQAAIDSLGAGTIYLSRGLFELTTHLTLRAQQALVGAQRQSVLRLASGGSSRAIWTADKAANLTIRSLTVDGNKTANGGPGSIELNHNTNVEVSDCEVSNTGGRGIFFVGGTEFRCLNNTVRATGRTVGDKGAAASVAVLSASAGAIAGNVIEDSLDYSIWIHSVGGHLTKDIRVEDNRIARGQYIGIGLGLGQIDARRNVIVSCVDNGIDIGRSQGAVVEQNTIMACGQGIVGDGAGNATITGNTVIDTTRTDAAGFGHGILAVARRGSTPQENIHVIGNTVRGAAGGGIVFDGIHASTITDNVVSNCARRGRREWAIQLADFIGVGTIRNRIARNRCFDDRSEKVQGGCVLLHEGTVFNVVEDNDFRGNANKGITSDGENVVRNNLT